MGIELSCLQQTANVGVPLERNAILIGNNTFSPAAYRPYLCRADFGRRTRRSIQTAVPKSRKTGKRYGLPVFAGLLSLQDVSLAVVTAGGACATTAVIATT